MPSIHQHSGWHRHGGYEQYPHSFQRGAQPPPPATGAQPPPPATGAVSQGTAQGAAPAAPAAHQHTEATVQQEITELLDELGTTEDAIGDVTAEYMITTPGKIPNEMYDLDDTTMGRGPVMAAPPATPSPPAHVPKPCTAKPVFAATVTHAGAHTTESQETKPSSLSGFAAHSTIFLVLALLLLLLLLICCILACVFSRLRKRCPGRTDLDCDSSEPLLGSPKLSDGSPKSGPSDSGSDKQK